MSKRTKPSDRSNVDIFQLLKEAAEKERKKRKAELLAALSLTEFFVEGSIAINKRTCKGVECKLCIEACPTNALFWKNGEVGIVPELCIYCGACVLSCIVDDCIRVVRRRENGEVERFSKPRDFTSIEHGVSGKKRCERVKDVFPEAEEYLKRYGKLK
jgi:NAD-dependent dihydropyrimidine dehydrogenase PreA subunit